MKAGRGLLPLLLALGLAALQLGPALLQPGATLLGNPRHPDNLGNQWLLVWVAERLAAGESLLHNAAYYWPIGDAPVLAGNGMEGLLYQLPHWIWGYPGAVVPYALLILAGNGLGAYALARSFGASRSSSLLALAAMGTAPFFVHELDAGRYSQVNAGPLLLFLAAFVRLRSGSGGLPMALLAAFLLSLTAHLYWYYAWFGVLAGILLVIEARPPAARLWPFSAAFLALTAPWAFVFARAWAQIPGTGEATFPPIEAWADAVPWALPLTVGPDGHPAAVLAAPFWALGLWGLLREGGRHKGLVAVALLFGWLMLGPEGGAYTALYGLVAPPAALLVAGAPRRRSARRHRGLCGPGLGCPPTAGPAAGGLGPGPAGPPGAADAGIRHPGPAAHDRLAAAGLRPPRRPARRRPLAPAPGPRGEQRPGAPLAAACPQEDPAGRPRPLGGAGAAPGLG